MSTICDCTDPQVLPDIIDTTCHVDLGQIQKIVFQKAGNAFASEAAIILIANWTPLLTAEDATKAQTTPFLTNIEIAAGGFVEVGGGNDSIDGVTSIAGENPVTLTALAKSTNQDSIVSMRALQCFKDLTVYFVLQNDCILARNTGGLGLPEGFPVSAGTLAVGALENLGFGTLDQNQLQFAMPADWADDAKQYVPTDFDAKTDLNVN